MKNLKKCIALLALVVPFMASCGKQPVHSHNYIEHRAKDATCTEVGNIHYFTCDGCDQVFNEAKETIKMEDTVIAALDHNYANLGIVSNPSKTSYTALESFDPTGLKLGLFCTRCSSFEAVTTTPTFDKDVLHATDTKVVASVNVGGTMKTVDIKVDVNKIGNAIIGAKDRYETKCHVSPDLSGVTATFGNVVTKVYDEHDVEVTNLGTLVEGSYTVEFTAEGDADHETARVSKPLDVSHDATLEVVNQKYKVSDADCLHYAVYNKSCICGAKGSATFEDVAGGYGDHIYQWAEGEGEDVLKCVAGGCTSVKDVFSKVPVHNNQSLDLSKDVVSIDVSTVNTTPKAIKSIMLGEIDLGNDPTNLNLGDIKEDLTMHGPDKIITVVALADDDSEHEYTINCELATKVLKTKTDLNVLHEADGTEAIYGYYVLGNDINMNGGQSDKSGSGKNQEFGFRGIFDGKGYTIDNYSPTWKPIFGRVGYHGIVRNVNLNNVSFQQGNQHGILSRTVGTATFSDICISLKSISEFNGHEGQLATQSGMITGSGANAEGCTTTYKNITVCANGLHIFGVLGVQIGVDKYENFNVFCKDYDVLGYSDLSNKVTSVEGVNVVLDAEHETQYLEKSMDTCAINLPAEYETMTVNRVIILGTSYNLGNNMSALNMAPIKATALSGNAVLNVEGTLNEEEVSVKIPVIIVDKAIRNANDLKLVCATSERNYISGYYVLANDIDNVTCDCTTDLSYSGNGFAGTFDGNGHTVTITSCVGHGVFNMINNGIVRNTNFVCNNMTENSKYHMLAHKTAGMLIENCTFTYNIVGYGTISPWAGVIAGAQGGSPSTLKNCTFTNTSASNAATYLFGYASNAYAYSSYMLIQGTLTVSGKTTYFACNSADGGGTVFENYVYDASGNKFVKVA